VQRLLQGYSNAQDINQRLSPIDYFRNTYGAGYLGKHGQNFQAGSLPGTEGFGSDQYNDWLSNADPLSFLASAGVAGGAIMPNGGNSDFQQWYKQNFIPDVQAQLEAARAAGATSPAAAPAATTPNGMDTPVYALGRHHRHGQGGGYQIPSVPQGDAAAATGGGTTPISLNDFIAGRDLTNEARQAYLFRSNAQRLPGPLALAGRWSWWG
jgi:hypothetical protein